MNIPQTLNLVVSAVKAQVYYIFLWFSFFNDKIKIEIYRKQFVKRNII